MLIPQAFFAGLLFLARCRRYMRRAPAHSALRATTMIRADERAVAPRMRRRGWLRPDP